MNKQELIKEYESIVKDDSLELCGCYNMTDKIFMRKIYKSVLEDLKQLDEPQKVTIPQFVADWYEDNKYMLETNLFECIYGIYKKRGQNKFTTFEEWLVDEHTTPFQTIVNMHQFGYEVEKEKRYIVKMKGMDKSSTILKLDEITSSWYLGEDAEYSYTKTAHTRKELEEAGFSEVFNSPLFEIEEVE